VYVAHTSSPLLYLRTASCIALCAWTGCHSLLSGIDRHLSSVEITLGCMEWFEAAPFDDGCLGARATLLQVKIPRKGFAMCCNGPPRRDVICVTIMPCAWTTVPARICPIGSACVFPRIHAASSTFTRAYIFIVRVASSPVDNLCLAYLKPSQWRHTGPVPGRAPFVSFRSSRKLFNSKQMGTAMRLLQRSSTTSHTICTASCEPSPPNATPLHRAAVAADGKVGRS
jgi:hypothetical protein